MIVVILWTHCRRQGMETVLSNMDSQALDARRDYGFPLRQQRSWYGTHEFKMNAKIVETNYVKSFRINKSVKKRTQNELKTNPKRTQMKPETAFSGRETGQNIPSDILLCRSRNQAAANPKRGSRITQKSWERTTLSLLESIKLPKNELKTNPKRTQKETQNELK